MTTGAGHGRSKTTGSYPEARGAHRPPRARGLDARGGERPRGTVTPRRHDDRRRSGPQRPRLGASGRDQPARERGNAVEGVRHDGHGDGGRVSRSPRSPSTSRNGWRGDFGRRAPRVVLTRTSNAGWGPCITERAAIGNRAHADAAISIHADGGPASGRGFHVIYPPSIRGLTDDIAQAVALLRAPDARRVPGRHGAAVCDAISAAPASRCAPTSAASTSRTCRRCSSRRGTCGTPTDARLLESPAFRERIAHGARSGHRALPSSLSAVKAHRGFPAAASRVS